MGFYMGYSWKIHNLFSSNMEIYCNHETKDNWRHGIIQWGLSISPAQ